MERPGAGAAADGLTADAVFFDVSASLVRGFFPSSFSADSGGVGRFGMALVVDGEDSGEEGAVR